MVLHHFLLLQATIAPRSHGHGLPLQRTYQSTTHAWPQTSVLDDRFVCYWNGDAMDGKEL
jgi:hypothetical protein